MDDVLNGSESDVESVEDWDINLPSEVLTGVKFAGTDTFVSDPCCVPHYGILFWYVGCWTS